MGEFNLWQVSHCDGEVSPMAWQSSRDSWTIGTCWWKVFLVYRLGHRMELYRGFHCRKKLSCWAPWLPFMIRNIYYSSQVRRGGFADKGSICQVGYGARGQEKGK